MPAQDTTHNSQDHLENAVQFSEDTSETALKKPRWFDVIMHNDDYTTQEFVVHVLQDFFYKSPADARKLMLCVHHRGKAVAGRYPKDVAQSKAQKVMNYARCNDMPLTLSLHPKENSSEHQ
ncbi:MAG: ATP-dependent Clp protease adaptor ClpS [Myxococcota bacterium]